MDGERIEIVLPVALKEVFEDVSPAFTLERGHDFEVALMLNPEVPSYIATGTAWSMAFSNPQYIQEVVNTGACKGGVSALGYSPLSFAVRGSDAVEPIYRREDIAAFLLEAKSIAITDGGTSGAQFSRLAADLNIEHEMQSKLRLLPGGGPMAALQNGDVEIAGLPLTNIAPVSGVYARAFCPFDMDVHIDLAFCLNAKANIATQRFAHWLLDPGRHGHLHRLGVRQTVETVVPDHGPTD